MKKGERESLPGSAKKRGDPGTRPRLGSFAEAADRLGDVKPLDRSKGPVVGPRSGTGLDRIDVEPAEHPPKRGAKQVLPRNKSHSQKGQSLSSRELRSLRSGRIRPEFAVDLHGFTREEARNRLCNAVARVRHSGRVCILVIHGKGYRSPDGEAVLKPALAQWIQEPPLVNRVAACCPAQVRDGGSGASYLLLRASGPAR
jgi:DNA-nicking Smr family endonuclease